MHIYRRQSFVYEAVRNRRGLWKIVAFEVESSYPFGLVRYKLRLDLPARQHVVYPERVPWPDGMSFLERFHEILGGGGSGAFAIAGAPASRVRAFEPGDDLRRIHWRSTARMAKLMVTEPESASPGSGALVFANMAPIQNGVDRNRELTIGRLTWLLDMARQENLSLTLYLGEPGSAHEVTPELVAVRYRIDAHSAQSDQQFHEAAAGLAMLTGIVADNQDEMLTPLLRAAAADGFANVGLVGATGELTWVSTTGHA
ncbi:MAG: DUF58 domain-containing protein [Candidatus Schekmanbacteria bacterium]|nr:DUF58 domain-containing protein [Candidatus Schekmanbacteria bacterium]